MTRRVFEYLHPERFVAGTVGEPGARSFYLQARDSGRVTAVLLEKTQVAALADRLNDILDTLVRRSGGQLPIPAVAPHDQIDMAPLESPVESEFRVATLSLAWDEDQESVVVEAFAVQELDDGDELAGADELADELADDIDDADQALPGSEEEIAAVLATVDVLRVTLSGVAARGFVERAERVVGAGRPSCPFCHLPLDPQGHICPRQNGYRRRA